MAIRKKPGKAHFEVGTMVRSVAVGRRAAFEGVITAWTGFGYHVQDSDGKGWDRDESELTLVKAEAQS